MDEDFSEEGEDEIEEIESSNQENFSESGNKDQKEMERISKRMAREFKATKKRRSGHPEPASD